MIQSSDTKTSTQSMSNDELFARMQIDCVGVKPVHEKTSVENKTIDMISTQKKAGRRKIVILNACYNDGFGDYMLGDKMVRYFNLCGQDASLLRYEIKKMANNFMFIQKSEDNIIDTSSLKEILITLVIAPGENLLTKMDIKSGLVLDIEWLKDISIEFCLKPEKILILNSMNTGERGLKIISEYKIKDKVMGFFCSSCKSVDIFRLGFGNKSTSLGYLAMPTDQIPSKLESSVSRVYNYFECRKITLDKNILFTYLPLHDRSEYDLSKPSHDDAVRNVFTVLGQFIQCVQLTNQTLAPNFSVIVTGVHKSILCKIENVPSIKWMMDSIGLDVFLDDEILDLCVSQKSPKLDTSCNEVDGLFESKINRRRLFFLSESLPHDIFMGIMYVATDSLITGEQSFFEYISINKRLPYYYCLNYLESLPIEIWECFTKNNKKSCGKSRVFECGSSLFRARFFNAKGFFHSEEAHTIFLMIRNHGTTILEEAMSFLKMIDTYIYDRKANDRILQLINN